LVKKILDAGCWMLDAGSNLSIQHPTSSIRHPASGIQHLLQAKINEKRQANLSTACRFFVLLAEIV
jgi:hypothetical protein